VLPGHILDNTALAVLDDMRGMEVWKWMLERQRSEHKDDLYVH
jgi:hypothetical protein